MIKSYIQATKDVYAQEMARDPKVFVLGEDLEIMGSAFAQFHGVREKVGEEKILNTPISETAIIGAAIGAAAVGMRPVAQLMFVDFTLVAMDQILNQAAKMRYMSGGKVKLPMVIHTQQGIGGNHSGQHSQCLEALFMHVPGIKIAMPSTPADAAGLLRTAIRDDDPVLILENKAYYYRSTKGEVPDDENFMIPFGQARIVRQGTDVTIVATHTCVQKAESAANQLIQEGISCEIIDPRTLVPFDWNTVLASVRKTGRLVVAHDAVKLAGPGAEIVSTVVEQAYDALKSRPLRVGAKYCTIPYSAVLEEAAIPQASDIYNAIKSVCAKEER